MFISVDVYSAYFRVIVIFYIRRSETMSTVKSMHSMRLGVEIRPVIRALPVLIFRFWMMAIKKAP
ncbi:hypothetical cytosolic protein [Syntrophus aciditrophicus SB]|uniref:Hypothetical cytosolic protein n=1 Tax=Syntrophus aciditrophicus (strain SB) TaxID=56780 RepID=Q2LW22_SYNAS|nr:hypothetical cytosolic protein [Syntrophus aciditrophicus SB]